MITSQQKSAIKQLLMSPAWGVVEQIKNDLLEKIRADSKLKDSEWETLKETILAEGQIIGMERLLNELMRTQI